MSEIVRGVGGCGALNDDASIVCILEIDHVGRHGFEDEPADSELHAAIRKWFVTHLGGEWKGYAHALACDLIEDGFTNEGHRR